jgi:hypothetical protein
MARLVRTASKERGETTGRKRVTWLRRAKSLNDAGGLVRRREGAKIKE